MKNPIKIIHKIKNNNRKIHYKVYIFIGSLVPSNIMEILKDIEEDDLLTTLLNITKKKYSEIEEYYGEFWYKLFFINEHVRGTIKYIIDTASKKKDLLNKYGIKIFRTDKEGDIKIISNGEFYEVSNLQN